MWCGNGVTAEMGVRNGVSVARETGVRCWTRDHSGTDLWWTQDWARGSNLSEGSTSIFVINS